jgi:hypothetical protein
LSYRELEDAVTAALEDNRQQQQQQQQQQQLGSFLPSSSSSSSPPQTGWVLAGSSSQPTDSPSDGATKTMAARTPSSSSSSSRPALPPLLRSTFLFWLDAQQRAATGQRRQVGPSLTQHGCVLLLPHVTCLGWPCSCLTAPASRGHGQPAVLCTPSGHGLTLDGTQLHTPAASGYLLAASVLPFSRHLKPPYRPPLLCLCRRCRCWRPSWWPSRRPQVRGAAGGGPAAGAGITGTQEGSNKDNGWMQAGQHQREQDEVSGAPALPAVLRHHPLDSASQCTWHVPVYTMSYPQLTPGPHAPPPLPPTHTHTQSGRRAAACCRPWPPAPPTAPTQHGSRSR